MNFATIFTGFGGFDIAAEWMGWEVIFQCENDEFCQKILKYYWPNTVQYGDIKTTDFRFWRGKIDVLAGGPPCQPASTAGKRKGTNDDRWLWPETIRAVREIKPRYAIFENPPGILSLEDGEPFEWILSSLENEGYKVEKFNIPACGIEADHERQRIWIVAYSMRERYNERTTTTNRIEKWSNDKKEQEITNRIRPKIDGFSNTTSNTNELNEYLSRFYSGRLSQFEASGIFDAFTDSMLERQSRQEHRKKESGQFAKTCISNDGTNWPTQSPICSRIHGFPGKLDGITFPKWRNESIKGFGNAIYPPIAFEIFKAVEEWENYT